jgi:hypothetical protein
MYPLSRLSGILLTVLILTETVFGQGVVKPPQVDSAEVYRRGDMVTVSGEGPRGAIEDAIIRATEPPADDSHKWHITIIKSKGCSHCEHLIKDFQTAPELTAYVAAQEPHKAWAHFVVYDQSDETQKWRLKAYRVVGYPTLVIQPPRNGMWGSPRTVVWQHTGYDGNAKKLGAEITSAVRRYAAVMAEKGYPKPVEIKSEEGVPTDDKGHPIEPSTPLTSTTSVNSEDFGVEGGARQADKPIGLDPPFSPPPRVDPFNPQPYYPVQPQPTPTWPPSPQPQPSQQPTVDPNNPATPGIIVQLLTQLISGLLGGQMTGNMLILILVTLRAVELYTKWTPTKVDDQVVAVVRQVVENLQRNQPSPISSPGQQNQLHNQTSPVTGNVVRG